MRKWHLLRQIYVDAKFVTAANRSNLNVRILFKYSLTLVKKPALCMLSVLKGTVMCFIVNFPTLVCTSNLHELHQHWNYSLYLHFVL